MSLQTNEDATNQQTNGRGLPRYLPPDARPYYGVRPPLNPRTDPLQYLLWRRAELHWFEFLWRAVQSRVPNFWNGGERLSASATRRQWQDRSFRIREHFEAASRSPDRLAMQRGQLDEQERMERLAWRQLTAQSTERHEDELPAPDPPLPLLNGSMQRSPTESTDASGVASDGTVGGGAAAARARALGGRANPRVTVLPPNGVIAAEREEASSTREPFPGLRAVEERHGPLTHSSAAPNPAAPLRPNQVFAETLQALREWEGARFDELITSDTRAADEEVDMAFGDAPAPPYTPAPPYPDTPAAYPPPPSYEESTNASTYQDDDDDEPAMHVREGRWIDGEDYEDSLRHGAGFVEFESDSGD